MSDPIWGPEKRYEHGIKTGGGTMRGDEAVRAAWTLRFADCSTACNVKAFDGAMYHVLGCVNQGRALPLSIEDERDGMYLLGDKRTWVRRDAFDAFIHGAERDRVSLASVQALIDRLDREDRAKLRVHMLAKYEDDGSEHRRVHER